MASATDLARNGAVEIEAGQHPTRKTRFGTRAVLEVVAVLATGGLHLACTEVFHSNGTFILVALVAWGTYAAICVRSNKGVLTGWGFSKDKLGRASAASSIVAVLAIFGMGVFAFRRGYLSFHLHMIPLLLLYPVWGITQQFLILGIATRNLVRLAGALRSPVIRYWSVSIVSA